MVVLGDAAERLADLAAEEAAELLVVGARGRTGFAAALLGSVSQRLAVTAGCPVLIVSPGAGERFRMDADTGGTIVCGVALSPVRVEVVDPVHELREQGAEACVRLIAVGTRGQGPVRRALLGSVSAALAATAPCPALVVPPTAELGDELDQIERNGAME